jgi:C4-dicarboxylate transporter DctQ subunit
MSKIQPVINRLEEGLMALLLAVMTFLTALQVLLRYVFNTGLIWSLEATTYTFGWLVLLGMAYGVRTRSHIAVNLLVSRLHGRTGRVLTFVSLAVCLAYSLLMLYGSSVFIQRLFQLGHEARDLPVARWILTIMLPLGFALLTFRFLELGWLLARGSVSRLGFGEQEIPDLVPDSGAGQEGTDNEEIEK